MARSVPRFTLKRTPLRRVSKKRQAALKVYSNLRKEFLESKPICEVCTTNDSSDIHHKLPLGRGGKLNDVTIFLAVCRVCHDKIHQDPKWAEENNYLLR